MLDAERKKLHDAEELLYKLDVQRRTIMMQLEELSKTKETDIQRLNWLDNELFLVKAKMAKVDSDISEIKIKIEDAKNSY